MITQTGIARATRNLLYIAQSVGDGVKRIELISSIQILRQQHWEMEKLLQKAEDDITNLKQENKQLREALAKCESEDVLVLSAKKRKAWSLLETIPTFLYQSETDIEFDIQTVIRFNLVTQKAFFSTGKE